MPEEVAPERSSLQSPGYVLELVQTGQQNLLTFEKRLALILDSINCPRRNKHVHELVITHSE